MNDLQFKEDGSPTFNEYDIVNLGRTGFVEVRYQYSWQIYEKLGVLYIFSGNVDGTHLCHNLQRLNTC